VRWLTRLGADAARRSTVRRWGARVEGFVSLAVT
jgi:hypothetical protein